MQGKPCRANAKIKSTTIGGMPLEQPAAPRSGTSSPSAADAESK